MHRFTARVVVLSAALSAQLAGVAEGQVLRDSSFEDFAVDNGTIDYTFSPLGSAGWSYDLAAPPFSGFQGRGIGVVDPFVPTSIVQPFPNPAILLVGSGTYEPAHGQQYLSLFTGQDNNGSGGPMVRVFQQRFIPAGSYEVSVAAASPGGTIPRRTGPSTVPLDEAPLENIPVGQSAFSFEVGPDRMRVGEIHRVSPGQDFTRFTSRFTLEQGMFGFGLQVFGDPDFTETIVIGNPFGSPITRIQQEAALVNFDEVTLCRDQGANDQILSVTYTTPAASGSTAELDLPDSITATFRLDDPLDDNRVREIGVCDFHLELDGVDVSTSDLDDFELELDENGQPINLDWRAPEVDSDNPLIARIDIANNDFQLTFGGTNTETGEDFEVFYSESTFTLTPAVAVDPLPGDFNDDDFVNAADYTVWRDHVGAPAGTLPNDPHDTGIGPEQYETWRQFFGAGTASAAAAVVPEPGSGMMVVGVLAAACLGLDRRHTRVG